MSESPLPRADLEFAKAAAELAAATRCTDVVLLDVSERSQVTHYFLIATGTSPRQMATVAEQIADLGGQMGFKPWRTSGAEAGKWILIDCVDVVVHLFDPPSRAFYDLEMLWGDCPKVALDIPATATPQSDQTAAALEAIQEVIDAAVEADDELVLMDMPGESSISEDDLSLRPSDETDDIEGIAAPPDDRSISYESISIEVTGEGSGSRGAGAARDDRPESARQKASAKKAPSQKTINKKKPRPAVKAKTAVQAKKLGTKRTGGGKGTASQGGKARPKPATPQKRSTAGGQAKGGKLKSKTSALKAKAPGKTSSKPQQAKAKPSRPKASIKKALKGKATGRTKTAPKSVKAALPASRAKVGGSRKTTSVKKRK